MWPSTTIPPSQSDLAKSHGIPKLRDIDSKLMAGVQHRERVHAWCEHVARKSGSGLAIVHSSRDRRLPCLFCPRLPQTGQVPIRLFAPKNTLSTLRKHADSGREVPWKLNHLSYPRHSCAILLRLARRARFPTQCFLLCALISLTDTCLPFLRITKPSYLCAPKLHSFGLLLTVVPKSP